LLENESAAWSSAYPFRRRITYFGQLFEERPPAAPPPWSRCDFEPLRQDAEIREALFSIQLLRGNRLESANVLAQSNARLRSLLVSAIGGSTTD
jgi:hypothetical protein